jgi:hypothetical protein
LSVFVGVAGVIGLALLIAPFIVAFQQPDPKNSPRMNADSTLLTTPA